MSGKTPPGQTATRIVPIAMVLLVSLFILQLLLVESTATKVTLSVILIVALAAALGCLVAAL